MPRPSAYGASGCSLLAHRFRIGTAERNPFVADIVITTFQLPAEGGRIQMGPVEIYHVARDSEGGVVVQGPFLYGDRFIPYNPDAPETPEQRRRRNYFQTVICDAKAGTTTTYDTGSGQLPKNDPVRVQSGFREPGLLPGSGFGRLPRSRMMKYANLGQQDVNGVQAHGDRWWVELAPDGSVVEENFTDQWVSDDLDSEVSVVSTLKTHHDEERAELVHIKRIEPDAKLFVLPEGRPVERTPK